MAVSSGPAISLPMVIHKLCTNAVKHGALSAPNGRVSISWAVSEDHPPRFKLHWKERGGPSVRELLERASVLGLQSKRYRANYRMSARLRFEADGLSCEVNIPLSVMHERPLAVVPSA